jgi:cyclic pyranopterin phosphate synthase
MNPPLDAPNLGTPLMDPFGRAITYLRVSVTDRCDFRCVYCMSEHMTFLPKQDLLTHEELDRVCSVFVDKGVRKLRITGGEPLVRRDILSLFRSLSRHLKAGALDELTLTTNGSQLARYAAELAACGVRRINVSIDTLDPDKFHRITRWGELGKVMAGLDAAQAAGLKVKINTVALKGVNEDEIERLMEWAHRRDMGITLIEVMPLGASRRAGSTSSCRSPSCGHGSRVATRWMTSTSGLAAPRATFESRRRAGRSGLSRR